jgi:uncharacterized protein YjbI with pentapeptide repeats
MNRFIAIFAICTAILSASAQTPPILKHTVLSNGELVLNWPVQTIAAGVTNLSASYQLEFATELTNWTAQGDLLRGASFPSRNISIRIDDALTRPATFLRVRAVFDFAGGNFAELFMRNATLPNTTFTGANFFNARLDGTSFDNANLLAADFRFATMNSVSATNADFTLARLSDADLTSADLRGASFVAAELSGATLTFADLTGADLRGAILEDMDTQFTRFHQTVVDPTTVFDRRSLAIWLIVNGQGAGRTFTDVDLSFSDLSGGDLSHVDLTGIDLSGVDFSNADLSGANLTNTVLRLLDLRGTKIDDATNITNKWRVIWDIINNPKPDRVHANADLSLAFFIGATLERADVHNSNFNLGIMDDVNFEGCKGASAKFTSVEFHGANFKNADLRGASFANSILDNVNFLGANLTNAIFLNVTFSNTTMPDGSIRN